ncbi:MAG: nucleotidyltransferase domain-containing protein [Phycisphaerae bacterium]|nr:nucleotidyltransferase domain-containing protein [Phycisphaerae bacterium]
MIEKDIIKKNIYSAVMNDSHLNMIDSVYLFGSYVDGKAKSDSDVDILIKFAPDATIGFFALADIQEHFENTIGKKVDLVTPDAVSKYFRESVLNQAEVVYER